MASTAERLVLDASYALEALLPTSRQWQLEALELFERIARGDIDARVPWIFFAEVAGTATRRTRGRQVDPQTALGFLETVDALGMPVDATQAHSATLHRAAMTWQCGAYDAIYLELALRLRLPLATRDGGMAAAARAAGVALF